MATAESTRAASNSNGLLALLSPIAPELARVEAALGQQTSEFHEGVQAYVDYVLGGTGKRLRPSLALLAGGATGAISAGHITLGVIVELIHVATLVHDDVLDEADLRHGLETSNSRWGNDISVLLGDCLFAHSLKLAASYPTPEICRRISEATNTVCSGEILQNRRRFDLDLTREEYTTILSMKTGALFAVSCELGAYLNGASIERVEALKDFGANLGIAYQIYDDCVDIFGQERKAGKSLGTDMKKGKLTLPFLLLLEHAQADRRQQIGAHIFHGNETQRRALHAEIMANGVVGESFAAIQDYIRRATVNLEMIPDNGHRRTLAGLLDFLSEQSRRLLNGAAA
jgi:octaprenyl-diphosphate synthase